MLTRFRRGVEASGLLRDYRCHQRFTPAHEFRLQKIRAAQRKRRPSGGVSSPRCPVANVRAAAVTRSPCQVPAS
jgi:hypothetical protein